MILSEIAAIKKAKTTIKSYLDFNMEVNRLRASQDTLRANLSVQITRMNELRNAIQIINQVEFLFFSLSTSWCVVPPLIRLLVIRHVYSPAS